MHYYTIETVPFGENCYILYDKVSKEASIIDPGGSYKEIVNFINQKNLIAKAIILTHAHADHIGALQELIHKYEGIEVIASKKEKKVLNNPINNLTIRFSLKYTIFEATMYVDDNDKYKLGDNEIKFVTTPGHTSGSMCIIADNLLFSGDTLFAGSIGRTDLPTGSYSEMEKSLKKLSQIEEDLLVLPGHGDMTTLGYEKSNNPFMRGL